MSIAALAIVLAATAAAQPESGRGPVPPLQVKSGGIVDEPESYEKATAAPDTKLEVEARCSETRLRASDVTLGWSVERPGTTTLRVDITSFPDGFATGKFVTSGELSPDDTKFEFPDGLPGIYYYWRLLAKTELGWTFAGSGRFEAPICPNDRDEEGR